MSGTIGRNRFIGNDRRNLFRTLDRSSRVVQPRPVHHISQLPPATLSQGRIMFVAGATKAFYFSDGTTWSAL